MADIIGSAFQMSGTLMASEGHKWAGKRKREAKNFEAEQMESYAGQIKASTQRAAAEERKKMELIESRAMALAAMSGGASDVSVVDAMSALSGMGAYRSMVALYEGEAKAREMRIGARVRRHEGILAEAGAEIDADTTMMTGMGSMFTKYAGSAPPGATSAGNQRGGEIHPRTRGDM